MGQTIAEKIAQSHMVAGPKDRPLKAGDFLTVRPDHIMTHDNTAAVMNKFRAIGVPKVKHPDQPVYILDHDIQNRSDANLAKYRNIEAFAKENGVDFYPAGTGIGHQIMCEQLYVRPGLLVVGSDSHSNMYGALSALGTPVVRTDAAAIWSTGEFWWQIPPTVKVHLTGKLPAGATGKDVIITLCGRYNQGEVLNTVIEFHGPGVATLSMDERFSISNMTTEWGGLAGWFPADDVTGKFITARLERIPAERLKKADLAHWNRDVLRPDPDAAYAAEIELDLSTITPHLAGPDSVQVMTSLSDMESQAIPVHKAYLVSCVNSRLSDLQAAAEVVRGKKIADGVGFYIAAASREVEDDARAGGAWQALLDAGATALPPGCGPCIGLGTGLLEDGEVGISATNRNFKGRMGSREARCYLASPAVVAASALAGTIKGPEGLPSGGKVSTTIVRTASRGAEAGAVEILDGFPTSITGRLVYLPQDNLNTDGIYGKDYTYREDMTPEMMAGVVMENYDPEFAGLSRPGDIMVGGFNFGTGSSREQAVTALQAAKIALVAAGSYSQTYLRNAFNNGMPCIASPELVEALRLYYRDRIDAGAKTIHGDEITVDFASGVITWNGTGFGFPTLGEVPQALVLAGGVENQVRTTLGL
ncbi:MAG: homoaconitase [Acidobacteria bacterium]|uniref:Homoaconitase, mitochondrial n=1 Tax=Candidatus Polarisedimenticola svalbardensis TaxID=2886004 RepID=A0A8J6Y138_9BACT|nr:homoaconitase [Candidatus Polarisedimenticola svalbardensis]